MANDNDARNAVSIWTPAAIALLGKLTDKEVAAQLRITKSAVFQARKARGIKTRSGNKVWTEEHLALLGKMCDQSLAYKLGIPKSTVTSRRTRSSIPPLNAPTEAFELPAEYLTRLGKVSDAKIAKAVGVSAPTISAYRRRLGIGATVEFGHPSEELNDLLGKDTDSNLARRFGVTTACVWLRRKKAGIPPYTKSINATRPGKDQNVPHLTEHRR
ncbi:hypothetical protein QMY54_00272 (plasmid) [Pseudomonas rhodesiae]|nr:hypothetical protein QMY54_00272 [Pseudomonas rhodesiae]